MTRNKSRANRPGAVTFAGVLIIVVSLLNVASTLLQLREAGVFSGRMQAPLVQNDALTDSALTLIGAVLVLALQSASLVTGLALLRLVRWAWSIEMALVGLTLLILLIRFFDNDPYYLGMLFNMIIAFALNQQEVQEAFGVRRRRDEQQA